MELVSSVRLPVAYASQRPSGDHRGSTISDSESAFDHSAAFPPSAFMSQIASSFSNAIREPSGENCASLPPSAILRMSPVSVEMLHTPSFCAGPAGPAVTIFVPSADQESDAQMKQKPSGTGRARVS